MAKTPKNLKEHLGRCNKYKAWRYANPSNNRDDEHMDRRAQSNPLENFLATSSDVLPTRWAMTSNKLCEQVLRIIAAGNLSFSFAENPEFVALLRHAYPDCSIPNRRSVAKALKRAVKRESTTLKDKLTGNDLKVSIALDAWTSGNNIAFLGIFLRSQEDAILK